MNIAIPTSTSATLLLPEPHYPVGGSRNQGKLISNKGISTTYYGSTPLFQGATGSTLQVITATTSKTKRMPRVQEFEEIPYDEGMALYDQIKHRHSALFRDLADL